MKAESYHQEKQEINGIPVEVVTYQIGSTWYCHVNNVDPGATIARASGSSRIQARDEAIKKVQKRL